MSRVDDTLGSPEGRFKYVGKIFMLFLFVSEFLKIKKCSDEEKN
jgi:hypothetical protein